MSPTFTWSSLTTSNSNYSLFLFITTLVLIGTSLRHEDRLKALSSRHRMISTIKSFRIAKMMTKASGIIVDRGELVLIEGIHYKTAFKR